MMLLRDVKDINSLFHYVDKCQGDVLLRHISGKEEFSLKSLFSRYIAIGRMCQAHGDEYEVFCMNKGDEQYMLKFFYALNQRKEGK